jgi:hypothetical protein
MAGATWARRDRAVAGVIWARHDVRTILGHMGDGMIECMA